MTYQELTNFFHDTILINVFGPDANTKSEALSLQEAFAADSLDCLDVLNQTKDYLHITISNSEIESLYARDGNDGVMIITYINFIAEKLNIAIPNERKQYELSMRALKLTTQTKQKLSYPNFVFQQVDDTIKQIKTDSIKREKILNYKIMYNGK